MSVVCGNVRGDRHASVEKDNCSATKRKKDIPFRVLYIHKCPYRIRRSRRVISVATLVVRPPRRPLRNKKIPRARLPRPFQKCLITVAPIRDDRTALLLFTYNTYRIVVPAAVTWVRAVLSQEQPRVQSRSLVYCTISYVLYDFSLETRDERRGGGEQRAVGHCLLLCNTTRFPHDKSVKSVNPPRMRRRFG